MRVKDDDRFKIIVCTLDPTFFAAASMAFERIHGDDSIYVRGIATEADGVLARSMDAAAQQASRRLDSVLALPESQRPPDEFVMLAMEPLVAEIAGLPYFGVAAALNDARAQIRVSSFSPLVQIDAETASSLSSAGRVPASYEWLGVQTDGQLPMSELLDAALRTLLGAYWRTQRQQGLVQDEAQVKE